LHDTTDVVPNSLRNPPHHRIAEVILILAFPTDIINVQPSALVRPHHGVVTIDGCRDTGPSRLGLVTTFNQAGAARVGIIHRLTLGITQNRRVSTFTAGHRAVVIVLGKAISKAVTNEDRLEIDIALLVREYLRCKLRDVVSVKVSRKSLG
jgi:hypothetical protein